MNLIQRTIQNRPHFWNGTGWSRDRRRARIYNDHDARQAHKAMTLDSIMATIREIKRKTSR
jgi:hypothetical protein